MFTVSWEIPPAALLPEFFLSILFPLVVYITYFPLARRDLSLNLAWFVFLIGAAYAYLFVELPQAASGNMTWSGRVTLLVLFVVSAGFFVRQQSGTFFSARRLPSDWRLWAVTVAFCAHLISRLGVLL